MPPGTVSLQDSSVNRVLNLFLIDRPGKVSTAQTWCHPTPPYCRSLYGGFDSCQWGYVIIVLDASTSTWNISTLDGRVCFSVVGTPNQEQIEIKYQLLNPSTPFRDVVDTARSVILAGGTMSPVRWFLFWFYWSDCYLQISDVVAQLFSHLPDGRLSIFSCGHIIPSSNLQTLVVSKGPRGSELEFKFDRRGDKNIVSLAYL